MVFKVIIIFQGNLYKNNMFNIVLIRKMIISCSSGIDKIYVKEFNEKSCERMLNLKVEVTVISDNGIQFSDSSE